MRSGVASWRGFAAAEFSVAPLLALERHVKDRAGGKGESRSDDVRNLGSPENSAQINKQARSVKTGLLCCRQVRE